MPAKKYRYRGSNEIVRFFDEPFARTREALTLAAIHDKWHFDAIRKQVIALTLLIHDLEEVPEPPPDTPGTD